MLRSSSATNGKPANPCVGSMSPLTSTRLTGAAFTAPTSDKRRRRRDRVALDQKPLAVVQHGEWNRA